ncbi:MAG: alanine racemase [Deltaproteobacteria bacterium]|nr:alanine racemase [Deltaproteobacteria bacterium]
MPFSAGRPTIAQIDGAALRSNLAAVRSGLAPGVGLLAVVKADAYGHGATLVAPLFERAGVDAFGAATVEEAVELRGAGVTKPIVVLTGAEPTQIEALLDYRLSVALLDAAMAQQMRPLLRGRRLSVHVKIDTGMGRLGVTPEELPALLQVVQGVPELSVEGIFSHFANADLGNQEFAAYQLQLFERAVATARSLGLRPRFLHLANSAAALTWPATHFSLIRPGLALYGIAPVANCSLPLAPAMRVVTRIVQLKAVPAERPLSYGQTFVTRRPSRIATIPVGYADGYDRRLSNRAQVLVRGRRAPVVGAVCMDLTLVDVSDIPDVARGDEVVLWGRQGEDEITVAEVAAWQSSITYEVMTRLGKRVPRVLRDDDSGGTNG